MSDNYRFYSQRIAASRSRARSGSLAGQLRDILETVRWCERMWALEDRLDREIEREKNRDA